MTTPMFMRIFISSPGDVAQERALAHQVIENLMHDPLLRDKIVLKAVAWDRRDSRTPMLATLTPQEALNQGMSRAADCDIVVIIFWSRMGTPLPPEYKKPDGSLYLSGTEYEFEDAMNAARNCVTHPVRPQVLVYKRTETVSFTPDPDRPDKLMEQFQQWQRVQDFFKAFVAADGSLKGGFNTYATPDDFRADLENDLKVILSRLLASPRLPATPPPPPEDLVTPEPWPPGKSPFPGLRSFMPGDAAIFFGRGRETDGLIARLSDSTYRFVCVVGASGSGKSSLVGAGLLPRLMGNALEGSKDWLWTRFTPGEVNEDPFIALAVALTKTIPTLEKRWPRARDLAAALMENPDFLIEAEMLADRPAWVELLLFIDQFEELFTLTAERHRPPFIDLLDRVAKTPRLRIVATLRADFYHRCVEFPKLAALLRSGSYPLAAPEIDAQLEMITRPADRARLAFETGLPGRILRDTGTDPGALALMAYTLDELYNHSIEQKNAKLTYAAYEALGGVQGAIGTRAQNVYDKLDKEIQEALPTVFRNLVEVDDRGTATRQRATLDRLTQGDGRGPAAKLVATLTEARLLMQNRGVGDLPVVEVAHEALLRSWPRLASWIAEAQEDLILLRQVKAAAEQWEQMARNKAFLWPHERLILVEQMRKRQNPDLTVLVRDFLKPEFERLMDEINNPATNHRRRASIGDRLAEIGDTRRGVGLRPDGLPDIVWCDVPGGTIILEGVELAPKPQKRGLFGRLAKAGVEPEDRRRLHVVKPLRMAQYPITCIQYKAFVDATDYRYELWWKGLGPVIEPYPPNWATDNHPVENVSWFEAVAFCRWLSAHYIAAGLMPRTAEIRLPTEWEWQQAVTGGKAENIYPWGLVWESEKSNSAEAGLSRTTAVGMYPQGAVTGLGLLDMNGNVLEWCLNEYYNTSGVDVAGTASRVMRGGSWADNGQPATSREEHGSPDSLNIYIGFRVVLAAPSL